MLRILLVFLLINLSSCTEKKKEEGFHLTGKTDQVPDKSMLYLHDLVNNKTLDSSVVTNGTFEFNRQLPYDPYWLIVHTADRSKSKDIWAENNAMTLNAVGTDFRQATITGSESDKLITELYKSMEGKDPETMRTMEKTFVDEHPDRVVSAFTLSNNLNSWGTKETRRLYNDLSDKAKNSAFGKKIADYLENATTPDVGEPFVNITMENPEGDLRSLSDLEGKVILLEYWASWCKPCRDENPELVDLYNEYHPKGFEIFAVSLDRDKEKWKDAIEKDGLSWTHVSDLQKPNKAAQLYGVAAIPDSFLIDRNGSVIAKKLRGDALRQKLEELFND